MTIVLLEVVISHYASATVTSAHHAPHGLHKSTHFLQLALQRPLATPGGEQKVLPVFF